MYPITFFPNRVWFLWLWHNNFSTSLWWGAHWIRELVLAWDRSWACGIHSLPHLQQQRHQAVQWPGGVARAKHNSLHYSGYVYYSNTLQLVPCMTTSWNQDTARYPWNQDHLFIASEIRTMRTLIITSPWNQDTSLYHIHVLLGPIKCLVALHYRAYSYSCFSCVQDSVSPVSLLVWLKVDGV